MKLYIEHNATISWSDLCVNLKCGFLHIILQDDVTLAAGDVAGITMDNDG